MVLVFESYRRIIHLFIAPGKHSSREVKYEVDEELNRRVSLWRGDITSLEIDCIVNAANSSLLGGGGGECHNSDGSHSHVLIMILSVFRYN